MVAVLFAPAAGPGPGLLVLAFTPVSAVYGRVASRSWDRADGPGQELPRPADPRDESEAQRADRNLGELLQELRWPGWASQILFGFLALAAVYTGFTWLSAAQRDLYLASLVPAAVGTALLVGPVAFHRLVFRRGQKERPVRAASVMAIGGLAAVGLCPSRPPSCW